MERRTILRTLLSLVVVLSLATVGHAYLQSSSQASNADLLAQMDVPFDQRENVAPPRENVTVVTSSPREGVPGTIRAFAPDGRLLYYNESHTKYFDVDPSPTGERTVSYVAATDLGRDCPANGYQVTCTLVAVERLNLSTGDVTRVHSAYTDGGMWHDVDRINETHLLVADIEEDRVFVSNLRTGLVEWEWQAQANYDIDSGGHLSDWTHLNDVEYLEDGRIMVNLRNQDQTVFIDRRTGLVENWTLGSDDDHSTLYEQHNPDYLPEENGGPALLVADSENNRIVEYQRANASWERTWVWSAPRTQWPRDADRLPDGNTLVTDSNGNRVLELNESGDVVWSVGVNTPYEAERLGTGDESENGATARQLGLESEGGASSTGGDSVASRQPSLATRVVLSVKSAVPGIVLNGLLFVLPPWMQAKELLALAAGVGSVVTWAGLELWWSNWTVDVRCRDD